MAPAIAMLAGLLALGGGDAALVAQPPSAAAPKPAADRFVLGVLRADGILLPFAAFKGNHWETPWPSGTDALELPIDLDAVPARWWGGTVPQRWRLWAPEPGDSFELKPQPLTPIAPAMMVVGDVRRLGIRTDFRAAPTAALPFELPFPKAGLAVAGEVVVEPIVTVSRRGPPGQELLASIRQDIDAAEERTINALRRNVGWGHPFGKTARARTPVELEAWYTSRLTDPDHGVSYIEAVKKYPPQPRDENCGLESLVSGWLHHEQRSPQSKEKPKTRLKVTVTYCDREKASYMLPLGRVVVRNRAHWIFQMSGQDHEWYEVVELRPGEVRFVAEYRAGARFLPDR